MLRTKNTKSLLRSLLAIGAAGALAGFGTFSAFSSTTENPGNQIDTGTVALSDNDAGSAMYNVANGGPGTSVDRCITVTYTGDMNSDVKVYLPDTVTPLGQYVDLTITPGTDASPSFGDCTGFVADPAPLYTGTLAAFRTAHNSWANGLADDPEGQSEWSVGDTVTYRFQLTVQNDNNAQGLATGTHRVVWEARNQ
jgi:predicted ribosomally synthesized peptide with SipW-like signal peptide